MKFALLYGSHRQQREGIKGARFVENKLKDRGHSVNFIDSMELDLPILDKRYSDYEKGNAPEKLEKLAALYIQVDGFMMVCGEYNQSIPPGLSNLIDHFKEEYFFKPSAIACYSTGPFGGIRAAIQMRVILGGVGMISIPTFFPMSQVHISFDSQGKALDQTYNDRIIKFLDEFEWYARALKAQREKDDF